MTLNEFGEDIALTYTLFVTVNEQDTIKVTAFSEDSLIGQLHKVDRAILTEISRQYQDLPESEIDND